MSLNREMEELCCKALKDSPKLKKEINEFVVAEILREDRIDLVYQLSNIGFRLQSLKQKGLVSNTAKCKDANEGLYAKGTWYITEAA